MRTATRHTLIVFVALFAILACLLWVGEDEGRPMVKLSSNVAVKKPRKHPRHRVATPPAPPSTSTGASALPLTNETHFGASVRAYRATSSQPIPNVTFTAIEMDAERWDTNGFHSTTAATSRLTAPFDGLYAVQGMMAIEGNPDGSRVCLLTTQHATTPPSHLGHMFWEEAQPGHAKELQGDEGGNAFSPSGIVRLRAGEYVEMFLWQNSGVSLRVLSADGIHAPELAMAWIGPYPEI